MGLKSTIGKLLPIAAAGLSILFPAAAPIIVGAAGIVGAYIATDGFSMGDFGAQAKDADLIQANFKSTQKTIPVVYGKRRVGSNDVFMEVSGEDKDRTMWIVGCLAEGECDSIAIDPETGKDQIYIDSIPVDEFNKTHGEKNGVDDIVQYHFHSGSSSQTVDPNINAAIPKFTDAMRNTCYIVWEIKWVKGLFAGMPTRQVVLKGKKVKDIRTGSIGFSRNPALHLYDLLTNTRFGLSFSEGMMDQDSFKKAVAYCEGGSSHPAWEVDYVVASQIKSQTAIDTLLAHFRGMLTWYDGYLFLRYAQLDEETVVGSINDGDIARDDKGYDLVTVTQPSSFMIPDSALIKYVSEHKNWTLDDVYVGDQLGYVAQYEFPGFTSKNLAMTMGIYMLERSQLNRTYSLTLRASNIIYEPNDIITITSSEAGLDQTLCRVIQSDIMRDGMVNISVIAEAQSLYNKVYDLDPDQIYSVNIADPSEAPPAVPWMGFSEEIYDYRSRSFVRLNVDYDIPTRTMEGVEYPWFDYAEVHASYDGENYNFLFNAPDDFQIDPISEGPVWIALVSVSSYGQKQAFENATIGYHNVKGISEIAPISELYFTITVTGSTIVIYAPLRRDPDIEGWEIRIGNDWYSNSWSDASLLSITSNPTVSFTSVKTGDHTIWLDVKGRNGLYSGNPLYKDFSIQSPPVGYSASDGSTPLEPIEVSYSEGTHYNTRAVNLGSHGIALQVNRGPSGDVSAGYYISKVYTLDSSSASSGRPMLVSVEAGTALIGGGNTWEDIAPGTGKDWNDVYPSSQQRNWRQVAGKSVEGSKIGIEIQTSMTGSSPWETTYGLEKITATVYGAKHLRFVFRLEDPQLSSFYTIGPATAAFFVIAPQIKELSSNQTKGVGKCTASLTLEPV